MQLLVHIWYFYKYTNLTVKVQPLLQYFAVTANDIESETIRVMLDRPELAVLEIPLNWGYIALQLQESIAGPSKDLVSAYEGVVPSGANNFVVMLIL